MARSLAELAARLIARGIGLGHPVDANILFPHWEPGISARLRAAGAQFYDAPAPEGREGARLVTSWATTEADVDALLAGIARTRKIFGKG